MRAMFCLMKDCGRRFSEHLSKKNEEVVSVEMKELFSRYTNDVIATSAFGVTCDSLENPNNEFYLMGKQTVNFSFSIILKFFGHAISPALMKVPIIVLLFKLYYNMLFFEYQFYKL